MHSKMKANYYEIFRSNIYIFKNNDNDDIQYYVVVVVYVLHAVLSSIQIYSGNC